VEVQKLLQEQEIIVYRQTVLNALQDVENALIASVKEQSHREALLAAVAANRKAISLAEKQYTEGLTNFINVLQAQEALYSMENALVQSTAAVSTNLVALYKALGGGNSPRIGNVRRGWLEPFRLWVNGICNKVWRGAEARLTAQAFETFHVDFGAIQSRSARQRKL
jgi:hypothetical protein